MGRTNHQNRGGLLLFYQHYIYIYPTILSIINHNSHKHYSHYSYKLPALYPSYPQFRSPISAVGPLRLSPALVRKAKGEPGGSEANKQWEEVGNGDVYLDFMGYNAD